MTFLDSAMVLVPSLTGLALTVYDGDSKTLSKFENRFCFSPELQQVYTQTGLGSFFEKFSDSYIYDIPDALGSRVVIFEAGKQWLLLGPYVEDGWSEHSAWLLLTRLGSLEAVSQYQAYYCKLPIIQQEFALKTALLLAEHMGCGSKTIKMVRLDRGGGDVAPTYSEAYADVAEINRRYQMEDRFIFAVSQGNAEMARKMLLEIRNASAGIRFLSDRLQDRLAGAAIVRTLVRMGAKQGGLSPVLIDSISQDFAQRMMNTVSNSELEHLILELVCRTCAKILERRYSGWSPSVRRAVDYMEANLSRPMTTAEIVRAVGEDKRSFAGRFLQDTGMTVKGFLAKKRCDIAAQLLADSDTSVQEIAAFVGYPDNNYFSKVFKANRGMPPLLYRTAYRKHVQEG